jgi:FtsP/CotA-like multicopper oxidase with cupredoxin domain
MKKIALLLAGAMIVAGAAFATETETPAATKAAPKAAAVKTHVVEAEVVSADATAGTLTIKGAPNKTVKVEPSAAEPLKTLKAGEKVKLTCRDNDKGEHEAVTHIAVEGAATAKAPTQK